MKEKVIIFEKHEIATLVNLLSNNKLHECAILIDEFCESKIEYIQSLIEVIKYTLSKGSVNQFENTFIGNPKLVSFAKNDVFIDKNAVASLLPNVIKKIFKTDSKIDFTIGEVVEIIESSSNNELTSSIVRNFVNRDFKNFFQNVHNKKYSPEHVALVFLIGELKTLLETNEIEQLLTMIFYQNNNEVFSPSFIYLLSTSIWEEITNVDESEIENEENSFPSRKVINQLLQSKEKDVLDVLNSVIFQFPEIKEREIQFLHSILELTLFANISNSYKKLGKTSFLSIMLSHSLDSK